MITKAIQLFMALSMLGCNTMPIIDLARESKCVTEVATKQSKLTCEFEGKKVFAKK